MSPPKPHLRFRSRDVASEATLALPEPSHELRSRRVPFQNQPNGGQGAKYYGYRGWSMLGWDGLGILKSPPVTKTFPKAES
jgi:hypothetical protein